VTRYPTYVQDIILNLGFERYTERHYRSWVKFALERGYPKDVRPVLVSGLDTTRDFATVAYELNESAPPQPPVIIHAAAAGLRVTNTTGVQLYINYGPENLLRTGNDPNESVQCIFIRYFSMRSRFMVARLVHAA